MTLSRALPKQQGRWQALAGLSIFITFVVVPVSLDFIKAYKEKRYSAATLGNNSIQKMVFEERKKLRELHERK